VTTHDEALLAELAEQETRLRLDRFTNDDAIALGLAVVESARAEGAAVTVDVRRGAHQLFHAALDGTSADNDAWVERKVRVVQRFGHSSLYVGVLLRVQGKTMEEAFLLDERDYAAHGGSFPIIVHGAGMVGTVTVSGLPQLEDHRIVVETLGRFVVGRGVAT
jgi:uncharacterized protein (UPF0303 family)